MASEQSSYDFSIKLLHWTSAILVIGLFTLGLWMVELDYYHKWYQTAPHWHRSFGILLMLLTVFRLWIKLVQPKVRPLESHQIWERALAKVIHWLLYVGLLVLFISGYLISTADGESIKVFNWFEVPALLELEDKDDLSGTVHKYVAYGFIGLVLLHILGALKHHFIDKDETFSRMLGRKLS
ncbi:cytochrome b [Kangiella sp. TOML190]|uniref:cytochrome b n=1 Tax=Kangiella sp. TOML190 TaxID=2931351 RepID=UPI00203C3DF7|nr:cytochrome b [Kangiella sp. TOML190]